MQIRTYRWLTIGLLITILLFGLAQRIRFVSDVVQNEGLYSFSPYGDDFNYDVAARNLLLEAPFDFHLPIYPEYTQFVSIIYGLFGAETVHVFWVQLALSVLATVFCVLTGRVLFGWIAGLCAGVFFLFYRMHFIYDVQLLNTGISQCLIMATLFFFCAYYKKPHFLLYLGFLAFGTFLSLFRIFFWILIVAGVIYLFIKHQHYKQKRMWSINSITILAAVFLFFSLHTPEKYEHKFGLLFYISNHENASGLLKNLDGVRLTAEAHAKDAILVAHEATGFQDNLERYWMDQAFDFIKEKPLSFLLLQLKKIHHLVNTYEIPNSTNLYVYEKLTLLRELPKITFGFIFGFGMFGIISAWIDQKKALFLLVPMGVLVLMMLAVHLSSRYRMPIVPFLCVFAGYGVTSFARYGSRWRVVESDPEKEAELEQKNMTKMRGARGASLVLLVIALWWSHTPSRYENIEHSTQRWLRHYEMRKEGMPAGNEMLERFLARDQLDDETFIQLTIDLGGRHRYIEFFTIIDEALQRAGKEHPQYNMMLHKNAQMSERVFDFTRSLDAWKELEQRGVFVTQAQEKQKNLAIMREYLTH